MLPIDSGWGHKAGILGGKTKECCSDNEVHEGLKGQAPHPFDSSAVIVIWRLQGREEFTDIRLLFSFPILEAQRTQNRDLNWYTGGGRPVCLTRVKLLGDAAHLFTVVRGHSWTTSLVLSSTLITDSLVIPRRRGTSLFLLFIFSCEKKFKKQRKKLWRVTSTKDKEDLD